MGRRRGLAGSARPLSWRGTSPSIRPGRATPAAAVQGNKKKVRQIEHGGFVYCSGCFFMPSSREKSIGQRRRWDNPRLAYLRIRKAPMVDREGAERIENKGRGSDDKISRDVMDTGGGVLSLLHTLTSRRFRANLMPKNGTGHESLRSFGKPTSSRA